MAEVSDPRIGTLLEGRYRLDTRLAAGGMGVVYKGELVAIGKPVAIKFLHDALAAVPDLVKRFQREATAMSRLAHPHIVSVVDSGLAGGVPFLVMDYVAGRSLAEVLADGPMPAARAAGITKQILAGAKHAHASGVVHRDLKPDNILMLADVEDDFVKILDFGLAKVVQRVGRFGDAADQHRVRAGDAGVHVARAGPRHRERRAFGPLLGRRHPLSDGDGAEAVRRRLAAGRVAHAHGRRADGADAAAAALLLAGTGEGDPAGDGQGSVRRAISRRGRSRRRWRRRPRRARPGSPTRAASGAGRGGQSRSARCCARWRRWWCWSASG